MTVVIALSILREAPAPRLTMQTVDGCTPSSLAIELSEARRFFSANLIH